jgi:hypothetical protein
VDIRASVPLYRCAQCGFVTTASRDTALAAHEQGSAECAGEVELIADFARQPVVNAPGGRRRRRPGAPPSTQAPPPPAERS